MKKIFVLFALISFTLFTACNKEEMADSFVPADETINEELPIYNTNKSDDNTVMAGIAAFTINNEDQTLYEGDDLLLTNNSLNAVSYHWDFGNGNTSTEANPTFNNYRKHGPFSITLTVTDARGNTHQASEDVLVHCIFGGGDHPF